MAGRSTGGSGWTVQHRPMVRGRRLSAAYAELSSRPLYVLVFLLPMLVFYEYGSWKFLTDPAQNLVETVKAQSILLGFFQDFGVGGRFLPALSLVAVLVAWHVIRGDSARLRPAVLAGMVVESIAWTIPLVVLIALVQLAGAGMGRVAAMAALQASPEALLRLSRPGLVTISLGAGLYEELLFRMVGMALLHFVLVDLARMSERVGMVFAVVVSAAAFAAYHDPFDPRGDIQVLKAVSLMFAGAYFGVVYYYRGFGIVVAVHALYDLFVLMALQPRP